MTETPLLDLIASSAARDAGIKLVLENEEEAWKEAYRGAAESFLLERVTGDEFAGEDIRAYAVANGLEQPHHPGCWAAMCGAAVRHWRKLGWIEHAGFQRARSVKSHRMPMRVYRVL